MPGFWCVGAGYAGIGHARRGDVYIKVGAGGHARTISRQARPPVNMPGMPGPGPGPWPTPTLALACSNLGLGLLKPRTSPAQAPAFARSSHALWVVKVGTLGAKSGRGDPPCPHAGARGGVGESPTHYSGAL